MHLRSAALRLTTCLLPAIFATAVPAPAQDRLQLELQTWLDSLHSTATFPGATLAVAWEDGRVLSLATGEADTIRNAALRPGTRMMAGSVGKTFFAALALALVEADSLELDAPIARWLGAESWFDRLPNARDITVRMLMNHTSGLVRYEFDDAFTRALVENPYRVWRPEEQLAFLFDTDAPFAAGQGWVYSDTNYIVLAMILERITGRLAYDEIRRRFLVPLRLDDTLPSDRPDLPGLVQGYAGTNPFADSDQMIGEDGRFVFNPAFEWGGGGFVSSAPDLARWAIALWGGSLLMEKTLRDVSTGIDAAGLGPGTQYGLGAILRDSPLGSSIGHSGFFPGYLTEVRYFPEQRLAVALQLNTSVGRSLGRSPAAVVLEAARRAASAGN